MITEDEWDGTARGPAKVRGGSPVTAAFPKPPSTTNPNPKPPSAFEEGVQPRTPQGRPSAKRSSLANLFGAESGSVGSSPLPPRRRLQAEQGPDDDGAHRGGALEARRFPLRDATAAPPQLKLNDDECGGGSADRSHVLRRNSSPGFLEPTATIRTGEQSDGGIRVHAQPPPPRRQQQQQQQLEDEPTGPPFAEAAGADCSPEQCRALATSLFEHYCSRNGHPSSSGGSSGAAAGLTRSQLQRCCRDAGIVGGGAAGRGAAADGAPLTRGEIDVIFSAVQGAQRAATFRQGGAFGGKSPGSSMALSPAQFLQALGLVAQKRFARAIQNGRCQKATALGRLAARFLAPFARLEEIALQ